MKIRRDKTLDNINYLGNDEDNNGNWDDYFMCPKCKENNYITIEHNKCCLCREPLEWISGLLLTKEQVDEINKAFPSISKTSDINKIEKPDFYANINIDSEKICKLYNINPTIIPTYVMDEFGKIRESLDKYIHIVSWYLFIEKQPQVDQEIEIYHKNGLITNIFWKLDIDFGSDEFPIF